MKGSRVESIEEARKEYKKPLREGWGKLIDSKVFFKTLFMSFLLKI